MIHGFLCIWFGFFGVEKVQHEFKEAREVEKMREKGSQEKKSQRGIGELG